ncbi:ATP-dependent DNA ligase [Bradyrhizobium sp. USDA 3397]
MALEGLVSKYRDRPYRGGRQKFWIKVKNRSHPQWRESYDTPQAVVSFLRGRAGTPWHNRKDHLPHPLLI